MTKARLALGTVQFGAAYGINNHTGIPSNEEITGIFAEAYSNGVRTLDTAPGYGDAESKIGLLAPQDFSIITKFPPCDSEKSFRISFENSLRQLNRQSIYGLLAHSAECLIVNPGLWKGLKAAKSAGLICKVGYSLYEPQQLHELLKLGMTPDIVQVPYSIFDRKFEECFPILKELNCEIHVRSVFLQGLYFMQPSALPEKLQSLAPALAQMIKICAEEGLNTGAVALNFALLQPLIDKVVIGVDSLQHLKTNLGYVCDAENMASACKEIARIEINDRQLLNPRNW